MVLTDEEMQKIIDLFLMIIGDDCVHQVGIHECMASDFAREIEKAVIEKIKKNPDNN